MKKLISILLLLSLAVIAFGQTRHFNRTCSVTGGSAQKLSTILSACGYTGVVSATELTIKNPISAANSLYVGQSDVDASNGYELEPGTTSTRRASDPSDTIDTSQIYLFVSSTQNAGLSLRTR